MTIEFNFNRLKNVYIKTLESLDKTLAFDLNIGRGRFLFMMFLSEEDKDSKDMVYLYMRNINTIKTIKLYGNHKKGTFKVYINEDVQKHMIRELQLGNTGRKFEFNNFLTEFNNCIPQEIRSENKIRTLRDNSDIIRSLNVIDEADKTVLIGTKKLSVGTPKDKTLRKLYIYTDSDEKDITKFIEILKKMNMTVCWTTEEGRYKVADIRELIEKFN